MLAAFFRSNQPAVLLAAPVLAVALFLPSFWHAPAVAAGGMPLAALAEDLIGASSVARALAGLVLLLVAVAQFVALVNDLELMERRNHLVAFLLPVVLAGCGGAGLYDPALLGLPLVLHALRRCWSISNTGGALKPLFDAGLLAGLAALCYLPYALVVIVVWASVSVIRPFSWREYVVPLLGVLVLFYLAWCALRLGGHGPWLPLRSVMLDDGHPARPWQDGAHKAFTGLLAATLLVALAAFNSSYAHSVMRGKNLRSAFMAFAFVLVVLMILLRLLKGSFPAILAAVPAGVLAGYALIQPRRAWLAELSALALLGLALWVRWA